MHFLHGVQKVGGGGGVDILI